MRYLIISQIKLLGDKDYVFSRVVSREKEKYVSYEEWLKSLNDKDLLAAFNRIQMAVWREQD
jgi:hypothetical protein